VVVLAIAFCVREGSGIRTRAFGAAILPALAVFGLYYAAFAISGGQYLGIN
jgi:hypothetical protein